MARCVAMRERAGRGSVKAVKPKNARKTESAKSCKYIVSIDFGTTFSGAAYAKYADLEDKSYKSDHAIDIIEQWPGEGEAGARPYCKTLTSVWYMPGLKPGTFELKGWGWKGYVDYRAMVQSGGFSAVGMIQQGNLTRDKPRDNPDTAEPRVSARAITSRPQKYGYFLTTDIKKGLTDRAKSEKDLPEGLTLERVISDYLRELCRHVHTQMRKRHGTDAGSHKEIQYVLTVPAIWTDDQKQTMEECFAMAGMVAGPACEDNGAASVHDLIIQTEPEAAAVHVHKTLETTLFRNGEKFLVVDVGGGTTDVIMHEKIGLTTRNHIKVREVSQSQGGLVGGSDVDDQLFIFLEKSIGCLMTFKNRNPRDILEINRWWNDIKCSFDGDCDRDFIMPISRKLATQWKKYDRETTVQHCRPRSYDFLKITSSDVKRIFDGVVEEILTLIKRQIVPGTKAILVVGGFSQSPYLSKRIQEEALHVKTIFMPSAGSAVARGAVSFGVRKDWSQMVTSRRSARTIGVETSVLFDPRKHKEEYKVIDEGPYKWSTMCDNIFSTIIRRGDEVPWNHVYKHVLKPLYRKGTQDGDEIELKMYETQLKRPRYVTDKGVNFLCTCLITVPRRRSLPREPKLLLSVHLGTLIRATVEGKNFSGERETFPPIRMKWSKDTEN